MHVLLALAAYGFCLLALLTAYAVVRVVLGLRDLSASQSVALAGVRS